MHTRSSTFADQIQQLLYSAQQMALATQSLEQQYAAHLTMLHALPLVHYSALVSHNQFRWDVEKHAAREAERLKQQQEKAKLRAIGLGCQWEGTVHWQVR
jgi:hypothetical protein